MGKGLEKAALKGGTGARAFPGGENRFLTDFLERKAGERAAARGVPRTKVFQSM